jgi:hypothetical protein
MDIDFFARVRVNGSDLHYYAKPSFNSWQVWRDDPVTQVTSSVGYTKRCRTDAAYMRAAFDLVIKDFERQQTDG